MPANYYKSLGVSPSASNSEIKRRYKQLAKIHHPDKRGDVRQMVVINKAYSVLSDPKKRYDYNQSLTALVKPNVTRPPSPPEANKANETRTNTGSKTSFEFGVKPFTTELLGKIVLNPVGLFALLFLILLLAGFLGAGSDGG